MKYEERDLTVQLSEAILETSHNLRMPMLTTDTGSGKTFVALRTAWLMGDDTEVLIFVPNAKIKEAGWQHSVDAFNKTMGSQLNIHHIKYSQLTSMNGPDEIDQIIQNIVHRQEYLTVPVEVTDQDTSFRINIKPFLKEAGFNLDLITRIRVEDKPLKKSLGEMVSRYYMEGDVNTKRVKNGTQTFYYKLRVDLEYEEEAYIPKILLVFDEAHMIKLATDGTMSKRAQMAIELTQIDVIDKVLALTATPGPNSYLDYGTYFIINGFYPNKTAYINEQIIYFDKDYHTPIVKDRNNQNEISDKFFRDPEKIRDMINQMTVHTDTSDVLPPSHLKTVEFDINNTDYYTEPYFADVFDDFEERTRLGHYKQVGKYVREGLFQQKVSATNTLRRITTLEPERIRHTARLVYNAFHGDNPHPVLIFYERNIEKDALIHFFHNNHHFEGITIQQVNAKYKEVETPKNDHTIVLIQYSAGGAAIEFPTSFTSIFFMPTYSYGNFKQARGRNVRSNMTNEVTHYILQARNSVDMDIWGVVRSKRTFTRRMEENYFTIYGDWR